MPAIEPQFTSKERDAETGLDFFGARYFSGTQGRFTSPDQPFVDQWETNPHSWNLYSYGRNNPLRFADPTGQKCVDTSNGQADDGTGGGCAAAGLNAALGAYGKEGEKNGVSVGFGALPGGAAGTTTPLGDTTSFAVTFDPSKWSKDVTNSAKYLASDVGHEGTHVDDLRQVFGGRSSLSDFSVEYRGYESSAFVFGALFRPALSASPSSSFGGEKSTNLLYGGSIIWNSSWGAADKAAIQSRDVGITNAVKSVYGHAETTPHNPLGN